MKTYFNLLFISTSNFLKSPQYEGDKNELHTDFIEFCWKKKLNRLEINSLGRELSKYGAHDKRKGSEREHVWSGITLRSKLKEEGQESLLIVNSPNLLYIT